MNIVEGDCQICGSRQRYPVPPGPGRGPDLTQRTRRWKVKP